MLKSDVVTLTWTAGTEVEQFTRAPGGPRTQLWRLRPRTAQLRAQIRRPTRAAYNKRLGRSKWTCASQSFEDQAPDLRGGVYPATMGYQLVTSYRYVLKARENLL
jgi:hypothetical protein